MVLEKVYDIPDEGQMTLDEFLRQTKLVGFISPDESEESVHVPIQEAQEPEFDIESLCSCEELYWFDCYKSDNRYKKFITPESFSHPAKASFGLIDRVYKHLEQLELLKRDDVVVDFMAGSGRIPLLAALDGHNVVAIELELHFTEMMTGFECDGESLISQPIHSFQRWLSLRCGLDLPHKTHHVFGNKTKAEDVIGRKLDFTIIQGDSRKLSELLGHGGVGVVSPAYGNRLSDNDRREYMDNEGKYGRPNTVYGDSPAQIGNLPDKPAKVGIVSPPHGDVMADQGHDPAKDKIYYEKGIVKNNYNPENKDNIGNLKDRPSLVGFTSPTHENSLNNGVGGTVDWREKYEEWGRAGRSVGNEYSSNPSNLGNTQGETYTQAMLQVYQEAFRAGISPLCIIVKNPTRKGKLRRLDISTVEMLQKAGYQILDYHRAILYKVAKNATLDGSKEAETYKGRLSFFKRLSLGKGNVAAEWEDILIAVNPSGNFGLLGATSPPYLAAGNQGGGIVDKGYEKNGNVDMGIASRNGYMAKFHSKNPDNIGNLKDKEK